VAARVASALRSTSARWRRSLVGSATPNASARRCCTPATSIAPHSSQITPPAKAGVTVWAAAIASSVLPMPPRPRTPTSAAWPPACSRAHSQARSSARPTSRLVLGAGTSAGTGAGGAWGVSWSSFASITRGRGSDHIQLVPHGNRVGDQPRREECGIDGGRLRQRGGQRSVPRPETAAHVEGDGGESFRRTAGARTAPPATAGQVRRRSARRRAGGRPRPAEPAGAAWPRPPLPRVRPGCGGRTCAPQPAARQRRTAPRHAARAAPACPAPAP
jgi:hypothetical protein